MIKWFSYSPVDTLFFKGSEPMEKGENHTSTLIFPPSTETISGAIRTTYLKQKNINIKNYNKGEVDEKVYEDVGLPGENAPFKIIGPLFLIEENVYIPAPYSWYYKRKSNTNQNNSDGDKEIEIIKGDYLNSPILKLKSKGIIWVKQNGEVESLGGKWVKVEEDMFSKSKLFFRDYNSFYIEEPRVGIGIDYVGNNKKINGKYTYRNGRVVIEGHIYSSTHVRLKKNVKIVFGIDKEIDLNEKGVMMLGGERRFGFYKIEKNFKIPEGKSGFFMILSAAKATEELNRVLICTGRIKYIGGWNMHIGFHKPMIGFYPAGTVFKERISSVFNIEI